MIAALPFLLLALQDFEVEARPLAWEDLGPQVFDLAWCLPEERRAPGADLLEEMEQLLALRFELPPGQPGGARLLCFGDLADASRARGGVERAAWLAQVLRSAPELEERWGRALRQLLLDDRLFGDGWDPDTDHARDGLLMGEPWDLSQEGVAPWNELGGNSLAEQAAILVWADLASWKQAEGDYRAYSRRAGAEYEEINPDPGTFFRGTDPEERPFSCLAISFRCDLPFPFSDYACRLHILNRVDARQRLVTDVYSVSDDFHWLAGRDVLLPVHRSDGRRIAFVVVRRQGFDLKGVPDGREHRRAGLRSGLGNLRREAEALQRTRAARDPTSGWEWPAFRVLGRR